MLRNERNIALLCFKVEIYKRMGDEFQNFFEEIMSKSNDGFKTVKPWGNVGDKKNDGFIPSTGTYYQVYAPENLVCATAIQKLETDLEGTVVHWNEVCPLRKFFYVVNDKYEGSPPDLLKKAIELGTKYGIEVEIMQARDLERIFLSLDEKMFDVVNFIEVSDRINIDFASLKSLIKYIVNMPYSTENEELLKPEEFEQKIKFNNLNDDVTSILNMYSIYTGEIKKYFDNVNKLEEYEVQIRLKEIYEESKKVIPDICEDCASLRFVYVKQMITPKNITFAVENAINALLAYYFESCDILENPNKEV